MDHIYCIKKDEMRKANPCFLFLLCYSK